MTTEEKVVSLLTRREDEENNIACEEFLDLDVEERIKTAMNI